MFEYMTRLSDLKPGDKAKIVHVGIKGPARRRYMEMGLIRGEIVEVVKIAPLGDPIEIEVKGYKLSLRKAEAKQVIVERIKDPWFEDKAVNTSSEDLRALVSEALKDVSSEKHPSGDRGYEKELKREEAMMALLTLPYGGEE